MSKEKEYKVDLDQVIRKNFESFQEGDFSMLTDEETNAFLRYIGFFVDFYLRKWGGSAQYIKDYELRDGDIVHEIFLQLINSKLANMKLTDEYKATSEFIKPIKWYLGMIIESRSRHIRKGNYGNNYYSLDNKINDEDDEEMMHFFASSDPSPLENYIKEKDEVYYNYLRYRIDKEPVFKMYFEKNMTLTDMAKELRVTQPYVFRLLNKKLDFLKLDLAEMGYLDKVKLADYEQMEYEHVVRAIQKQGVLGVYACNDDVLTPKKMSKYLKVSDTNFSMKINEDTRVVVDKLKKNGVRIMRENRRTVVKLFLSLMENGSKGFVDLPDDLIKDVYSMIKSDKTLVNYYIYSTNAKNCKKYWANKGLDVTIDKDKNIVDNMAEDALFNLQSKVKRYIKQNKIIDKAKEKESRNTNNLHINNSMKSDGRDGR